MNAITSVDTDLTGTLANFRGAQADLDALR
jgi:hypothetical protein